MTGDTLRDATRKVAAAARRHLGPHPSPEELIAYTAGELSPGDEARLQDHLALCPECTATVLDLASFPRIDLRPGAPGPAKELVPDWQNVRETLQAGDREEAEARTGGPPPWRERLLLALAAGFFLATLGLSYRLITVENRPAVRELARGDLPFFTLTADGVDRTRGEELLAVAGDRFNLMLFVAKPGSYENYSLQAVARPDDRAVVWKLDELAPTPEGVFLVVGLSRRELPPGPYLLRLYGGRRLVAEYQVSIEYH